MTYEEVKAIIDDSSPGTYLRVSWERVIPVRAGFVGVGVIKKHSSQTIRTGVDYDNMKAVKEKRVSGELPLVNQGLPWGRYVKFPYYVENDSGTKKYLRMALDKNNLPESYFTINGQVVTEQDVLRFVTPSAIRSKATDTRVVSVENITSIKRERRKK